MKCNHENIVVAHYGYKVEGKTYSKLACCVRCAECDASLFKSEDKGVDAAYTFIGSTKSKYSSLMDLTCDNLNKKYNIEDGFNKNF